MRQQKREDLRDYYDYIIQQALAKHTQIESPSIFRTKVLKDESERIAPLDSLKNFAWKTVQK